MGGAGWDDELKGMGLQVCGKVYLAVYTNASLINCQPEVVY